MNRYNVRTYEEFCTAALSAKQCGATVINIEEDIILNRPVDFSGCSDIEITSEKGHILMGGIINPKWKKEGAYLTFRTDTEPRMLIINKKPAKKTSFPADGYLENTDVSGYNWMNSRNGGWDKKPTRYDLTHISAKTSDIPEDLDMQNCDIRVIHQWDESTVSVNGYDASTGTVECENEMAHPAGAFGVHKYQFLNTGYGTPQKGRWFYDRQDKKVYYCPADGETEDNISSMIPTSSSLIIIKDCDNIKINNLKLTLSNADTGKISGLRAINPRGAIQVENSRNISLDMLEIAFSGGQGIKCLKSKNIAITNCIIENCASCGIATFECEDEHISYNVVQNIGLCDFSAVSVHAGGKSELVYVLDGSKEEQGQSVIEYNSINGSPYCGIVCSGGPHIIRNNKVTKCMQTLKDGGAVYCSRANGTLIEGNYVSDVPSDTAYAFYLDELSENCVVDGNVSVNVNIPFTAHIAKSCILSNNIAINNDETKIRIVHSTNFKWINNMVVSEGDFTLYIKSYEPVYALPLEKCINIDGFFVNAPAIKVDPEEQIDFEKTDKLVFTEENCRFVFQSLPCNIKNKYIATKSEPHCIITKIKPEKEEEYKKLHSEIWDMVVKNGHLYNIRNYSIFKFNGMYVSFFEYIGDDYEADMKKKALLPITKKWQKLCSQCFEEIEEKPENIFFDRF